MEKEQYDGSIGRTNETKQVCFIIQFPNGEQCFVYDAEQCEFIANGEDYTELLTDHHVTVHYEQNEDGLVGTILGMEWDIYIGV